MIDQNFVYADSYVTILGKIIPKDVTHQLQYATYDTRCGCINVTMKEISLLVAVLLVDICLGVKTCKLKICPTGLHVCSCL